MINRHSLERVAGSSFSHGFCKPLYGTYCFSQIPATIKRLLTKEKGGLPLDCGDGEYDRVILFLIDGFGWNFFERYVEKYSFLKRFLERGVVSKITSQFPSTTAAHVTCLNTGLEVGQSGLYEWFCYEPSLDRIITPLLFSFAGNKEEGSLSKVGANPNALYPAPTFYESLQRKGIASFAFQDHNIATSSYSGALFKGASVIGFDTFSQGMESLLKLGDKKGYFYIYFGEIDAQAHRHGLYSSQVDKAVETCFETLEKLFWQGFPQGNGKTAVILTADHGMTEIDPKTTFYLNEKIPECKDFIRKNKEGKLLVPAGSCRDFFLHVEPHKKTEAHFLLAEKLKEFAVVYDVKELIAEGFFGTATPSSRFLERIADLVIFPLENHSVWWHERPRFEQKFFAMHGGLTRPEMESIFLFQERPLKTTMGA